MEVYRIQRGDTLTKIANVYGTTVQNLLELNPELKPNPNLIITGRTLNIRQTNSESVAENEDLQSTPIMGLEVEHQEPAEEVTTRASLQANPQEPFKESNSRDVFVYGLTGAFAYDAMKRIHPHARSCARTAKESIVKQAQHVKVAAKSAKKYVRTKAGQVGTKLRTSASNIKKFAKEKAVSAKEFTKVSAKKVRTKAQSAKTYVKAKTVQAKGALKKVPAKVGKAASKTKTAVKAGAKTSKGFMGAVGKVAKPVAIAYSAVEIYDSYNTGGKKAALKTSAKVGTEVGSAWLGAKAGAAIGAVGGPVGMAVGGAVGGLVGWFAGEKFAEKVIK